MSRKNPGGIDPDGLLVQLDTRLAAIKQATREANEAIQGVKEVLREAKQYRAELEESTQKIVDDRVSEAVAIGLEAFKESLDKAIEGATKQTYARFDELTSLLLGETKTQRRRGEFSLTEIVEQRAGKKVEDSVLDPNCTHNFTISGKCLNCHPDLQARVDGGA